MPGARIKSRRVSSYGKIIVAKGNPSRCSGYEIAHFVVRGREVKSLSERDVFLPSLTKAMQWILKKYPSAKLSHGRKDHNGRLAALCFRCPLSEMQPGLC